MRCSIIREPIPLINFVGFDFSLKNKVGLALSGLYAGDQPNKAVIDVIALLESAGKATKYPNDLEEYYTHSTVFSYITGTNWTKKPITLSNQTYILYQNKLTFGVAKATTILSFIVKDKTSDSQTFYEDLMGQVLIDDDIKKLSWLLAVGSTITGRELNAFKVSSRLEKVNTVTVFNHSLQIETSNSKAPKLMTISADNMSCFIDLNTIKCVTFRKTDDDILKIIYTTNNKIDYTLEFI